MFLHLVLLCVPLGGNAGRRRDWPRPCATHGRWRSYRAVHAREMRTGRYRGARERNYTRRPKMRRPHSLPESALCEGRRSGEPSVGAGGVRITPCEDGAQSCRKRRWRESHPGRSACGRIEHRAIPRLKAAHSSQTGDRPESSQILETRDFRVGHKGPLLRTASS